MSNVRVINLSFIEINSGYTDLFRRTYSINNINANSIGRIQSALVEGFSNGGRVVPGFISRELGDVMGLTKRAGNLIEIPNGWREKRLRFVMVVEIDGISGYKQRYIMQGFTDYPGVTANSVDFNMRMYVNSVTEAMVRFDPYSGQEVVNIGNVYNTLKDLSDHAGYVTSPEETLTMVRPYDLNVSEALSNSYSYENGEPYNVSNILNVSDYTSHSSKTSFRKNSSPDVYFARLLNGYNVGKNMSMINGDGGSPEEHVFMEAAENTIEPKLSKNHFIARLQMITNRISPSDFTYQELMMVDPNVDKIKSIFISGVSAYGRMISANEDISPENCSQTLQPTLINMKILELNNSISAMLGTCGLSEAYITIKLGLQPCSFITQANSLLGDSAVISGTNMLTQAIESSIIPKLMYNLEMELEITMACDLFKDTTIMVRYNTGETEVFKFPTFADSLFSPVIGTQTQKNTLRQDLRMIYNDMMPYRNY